VREFPVPVSSESLSDVSRSAICCIPNLSPELEVPRYWFLLRDVVDELTQFVGPLPGNQFREVRRTHSPPIDASRVPAAARA
jgi:hypothetical protein